MQQELLQSYPERRKRAAGYICKVAFYTIPRYGWIAIIVLFIGLYMVFPASQYILQLYSEKTTPYEIIASIDNNEINLDDLVQIKGVEMVTPIIQLECQVTCGEKTVDFTVDAIYSSYLNLKLVNGTYFTDNTNMPYLLINEAAAKAFSETDNDAGIGVQETVSVKCVNMQSMAIICGLFRDQKKVPKIYMSYEVARKLFVKEDSETNIAVCLSNRGVEESVASQLQRMGFAVDTDSDATLMWNLLEQQTEQLYVLSVSILLCSTILFFRSIRQENEKLYDEKYILMLSGLTTRQVRRIPRLRLLILYAICFSVVCGIAYFFKTFSFLATANCFVSLGGQFVFCCRLTRET